MGQLNQRVTQKAFGKNGSKPGNPPVVSLASLI